MRSSGSVRRDRVYCCYADKCGSERVTLLNPASFGKLVRIIFPNVQTRRLGVRGESKYHYVDLSLKEPEQPVVNGVPGSVDTQIVTKQENDRHTSASQQRYTFHSKEHRVVVKLKSLTSIHISLHNLHQPEPSNSTEPQPTSQPPRERHIAPLHTDPCACKPPNNSGFDSNSLVDIDDSIMATRQAVDQLLHFVSPNQEPSTVDNDALILPDIRGYIPPQTDTDIADALAALYRSHCISVIDSFRYCREKNLFRHFTSFQGTLTVPVQKLLVHPDLAAWIRECDWVMYQKMIACVAPLTMQVVPDPVLAAFKSISRKLAPHIQETLKSHPEHVMYSRLTPARIFCHLVKRLLDVNQAANSAAIWLCRAEYRNKMWEDFSTFVDPVDIVSSAAIPRCSIHGVIQILKEQTKELLSPLNTQSSEVQLFDEDLGYKKFTYSSNSADEYENFPDRWISFILSLSQTFPRHSAKCIIEKADAVWTSVLHRLTFAGAQSFSAWWMTKVFFLEMMLWQAESGGFMNSTSTHKPKGLSDRTSSVAAHPTSPQERNVETNVSPTHDSIMAEPENGRPTSSGDKNSRPEASSPENITAAPAEKPNTASQTDITMANRSANNDDSAIDLDEESTLLTVPKYGDMTASDPADADGDVVVI